MTTQKLDPTLDEFLSHLNVSADKKAKLSNLSSRHQEAALALLEETFAVGRVRGQLAKVTAELKQVNASKACLDQELKKAKRMLSMERQLNAKNQALSERCLARLNQEIALLKKKKPLNNRDRETFALRREEHKDGVRERVRKHRLKRQYQELLAQLTEFRRATQTESIVLTVGVSDVRTMCGRIKTEAQKLGKRVAIP